MSVLPTAVCTIESLEAEFEKLGLGSRPDEQREWASEFLKQSLRRGVVLVDDSEESNRGSDFLLVNPLRVGEEIKKFYEETQRGFKHDRRWSDGGEASSLRDRGVTTRRQCAALGYSLKDDRQAGRVRAVKPERSRKCRQTMGSGPIRAWNRTMSERDRVFRNLP